MIAFLLFLILAVLVIGGLIHITSEAMAFVIGFAIVAIGFIIHIIRKNR